MDEVIGWLVMVLAGLVAFGYLLMGLWWLFLHIWPFLLVAAVVAVVVAVRRPVVRQQRALRDAARRHAEAVRRLDAEHARARADMERIAREW